MMAMSQYTTEKGLTSLAGSPTTLEGIRGSVDKICSRKLFCFPTSRKHKASSSSQRLQLISDVYSRIDTEKELH